MYGSCIMYQNRKETIYSNNKYPLLPMIWEDLYLTFRPTTMQWISHYNSTRIMMNTLAARFEENCKNHIAINFERKLKQWFKYKINNKKHHWKNLKAQLKSCQAINR